MRYRPDASEKRDTLLFPVVAVTRAPRSGLPASSFTMPESVPIVSATARLEMAKTIQPMTVDAQTRRYLFFIEASRSGRRFLLKLVAPFAPTLPLERG